MIVNNSTNINKTLFNNYPLSQTIKHKTNHDRALEIQVMTLNRHKHVAYLNQLPVMGSQQPPLIIGSPTTITNINKQTKIQHRFSSTEKDYTVSLEWMTTYIGEQYNMHFYQKLMKIYKLKSWYLHVSFYQKLMKIYKLKSWYLCINYILLLNEIFFSVFFQCSYVTIVIAMVMVCAYNCR